MNFWPLSCAYLIPQTKDKDMFESVLFWAFITLVILVVIHLITLAIRKIL